MVITGENSINTEKELDGRVNGILYCESIDEGKAKKGYYYLLGSPWPFKGITEGDIIDLALDRCFRMMMEAAQQQLEQQQQLRQEEEDAQMIGRLLDAEGKAGEEGKAEEEEDEIQAGVSANITTKWVESGGKHLFGGKRRNSFTSKKIKTYKRKNKRSKRIRKSRRSFIKKTKKSRGKRSRKRMVGGSGEGKIEGQIEGKIKKLRKLIDFYEGDLRQKKMSLKELTSELIDQKKEAVKMLQQFKGTDTSLLNAEIEKLQIQLNLIQP